MTFATKITVVRILLVPVFAALAIAYGLTVKTGAPDESLRWWALAVFIIAAASDGLDGWIARHFNQCSDLGAYLDPIADKSLLLTAILTLSIFDWGPDGWSIPLWFAILVFARDTTILVGVRWLQHIKLPIKIQPQWQGKACTVSQMFALAWVMLKFTTFDPLYPCLLAAFFTLWSGIEYVRTGWSHLCAARQKS